MFQPVPSGVLQPSHRAFMIDLNNIVAIDIHTHADGPCGSEAWGDAQEFQAGMEAFFKFKFENKPIEEIADYYRKRKIAAVIFHVDSEHHLGHRRYANEEVARLANENSDILIPFASI